MIGVSGGGLEGGGEENSKEPLEGERSLREKRSFIEGVTNDKSDLGSEYLLQIKKMAVLTSGVNYRHSAWTTEESQRSGQRENEISGGRNLVRPAPISTGLKEVWTPVDGMCPGGLDVEVSVPDGGANCFPKGFIPELVEGSKNDEYFKNTFTMPQLSEMTKLIGVEVFKLPTIVEFFKAFLLNTKRYLKNQQTEWQVGQDTGISENIDHQVLETRNTCREILDYIGAMEERFHLLRDFHKSAAILLQNVIAEATSPEKSQSRSPGRSLGKTLRQKSPRKVRDRSRRLSPLQPKGTRLSSDQDLQGMYCKGGALNQSMLRSYTTDGRADPPNQTQPKTKLVKFIDGIKIQFSNKLNLEAINEQFLESTSIPELRRAQPGPDLSGKNFIPRAAGFNILSNLNPKIKDGPHWGSEKVDFRSLTPPKRTPSQGKFPSEREMRRAHLDMDNPTSLSNQNTERL